MVFCCSELAVSVISEWRQEVQVVSGDLELPSAGLSEGLVLLIS
jgi:hypothetical protein